MAGTQPGSIAEGAALASRIHAFIERFLASPENNNLGPGTTAKAWDGFLLGFSRGSDKLYAHLKQHIGDFHWTPAEAFVLGMGVEHPAASCASPALPAPAAAEELTVVSWSLVQTEQTKASNRLQTLFPSEPWARARVFGQECNRRLHLALVAALAEWGHQAVAPEFLPQACEAESPTYGRASTWSERHVAHISGLGTFGLSGGLITERGQAHRLGSVIVRAVIEPTPHPYFGPFAYCLHHSYGICGACAERCPAGSINPSGRDKSACGRHLDATGRRVRQEYGFDGYGCGLCQTGVPCESGIPTPQET
jgi:epoxyqueuosine reductase